MSDGWTPGRIPPDVPPAVGPHEKECICHTCMVECDCDFDPYEYDDGHGGSADDESFHFRRTCRMCGYVWWSYHCAHDGVQNRCGACGWRPPGTESPMEFIGLEAPPGGVARLPLEHDGPRIGGCVSFVVNGEELIRHDDDE